MDLGEQESGLVAYINVPSIIGAVVSSRLATFNELQTIYSVEDVYDLLEVLSVDAHNRKVMQARDADSH